MFLYSVLLCCACPFIFVFGQEDWLWIRVRHFRKFALGDDDDEWNLMQKYRNLAKKRVPSKENGSRFPRGAGGSPPPSAALAF
jgi:hypothetical protein